MNENQMMHLLGEIESSVKSAHKRIDSIEKLTESVYKLATSIESMQHDIADVKRRMNTYEERPLLPPCQHTKDFERYDSNMEKIEHEVQEIKEQPAKKWNVFVTAIITSLTGGILGYILAGVFK